MSLKKVELYVEGKQIDLYGDEAFLLNFNIADISDISAKAASYSKEVDIPASKINNQIFTHLFDVSSEGYFNPISKKTTELFIDGVCVMRGFFKLNSITIIDNEYVTYHGVIYEDSVNFIGALGDLELSNLLWQASGTTVTSGITTGTITFDDYYGTDYKQTTTSSSNGPGTIPQLTVNRNYNSNNNGLSFTGGVFGSLQNIKKDVLIWGGGTNSNPNIQAFVPFYDVNISLTATIRFNVSRAVKWAFRKATYNASTGLWSHFDILTGPSGTVIPSVTLLTATMPTTQILTGQAIYFVVYDAFPQAGIASPPLPINASLSSVTGTIQSVQLQATNSATITEGLIMENITTVTGATNGLYTFPLIDYNQTYPYSATNVTLTNQTEATEASVRIHFNDLRPALFVKHIWDKIFKQAGFKYKSKFLDTNADLFNKLIIIGGMEEDEILSTQFDAVLTGTTGTYYTLEEPIQDTDDPSSGTAQTGYSYKSFLVGGSFPNNASTGQWKINTNKYSYTEFLKAKHIWADKLNAAHGYSGADYGFVLKALVAGRYKVEANIDALSLPVLFGVNTAQTIYQGITYRLKVEVLKNGSWANSPDLFTVPQKSKWVEKKVATFKRDTNQLNQYFTLNINETIELEKGDLCRVVLLASAEAQNDPSSINTTGYKSVTQLNFGKCYVKYSRCGTWLNKTITSYTDMIPKGLKQSDFVLGIAKMFNLYFEPDKQDPKTLYIEPRDVYYEDGRVLNWEKKLDYSKPLDINILSHDQPKNFVFKYADDSTDFNTEQFKKFTPNGLTFGSFKYTSPNEYTTDTQDLEVPFASSYLQKISGTDPLNNVTGTTFAPIVITKIIDPESQKPGYNGDPAEWKKEPRILYYGGAIQLAPQISRNYSLYFVGNEPDGDEYNIEMNYYAYAGHYDKPVNPTIDINFYTDTHYLPTTYWNSISGNTITSQSTSTIDLSLLVVGNNVSINLVTPGNFAINSAVDKYVKIYSTTDPTKYFIGLIVTSGITFMTVKVVQVFGTGSISNWKVVLNDVYLKYNLFNVFYKNQMVELTDQTARLMTCYMYLTPTDIANFRFNDIVYAHKEYWRVNKIIDFDTSSDVNQTTRVELIKILRADTNKLIDYIQGGYLGVFGGTGGGVSTGSGSTTAGSTPSVVNMSPYGGPGFYNQDTLGMFMMTNNNIILDSESQAPTYFQMGETVYTGNEDIYDTISNQVLLTQQLLNAPADKPIGESITYTDENAGPQTLDGRYSQVYFDVRARNILFIITLQDVAAVDGFTVHFDALNATTTTFMQIENGNATTNEIFVINEDNSVVAKYDGTKELWIISKA
jgi:hypothetical protein